MHFGARSIYRSLVSWLLAFCAPLAFANSAENQLKVAFIYNFAKLVEWPADALAGDKFAVCTFGADALDGALQALDGKSAGSRKIAVQAISKADDAKSCQILFIPEAERASFDKIIPALNSLAVLTVSDCDSFVSAGGMMGLLRANNKIQLKLNLKATQQARLKLSPQLIKLAGTE
jgi:hypothetical protein